MKRMRKSGLGPWLGISVFSLLGLTPLAPRTAAAGVVAPAAPAGRSAAAGAGASGAQEEERGVDAARKAVLAMRDACAVNMMSRVYRPQPDCQPRRAAVLKMGEVAVVALRAELLAHVARLAAEPEGAAPRRVFPGGGRMGNQMLVGALRQLATPTANDRRGAALSGSAIEALLDVVTAPGVERDPWSVMLPAHEALKALTKAKIEVTPRSQAEMAQVSQAWRRFRAEQEAAPPGANPSAPSADPGPVEPVGPAGPVGPPVARERVSLEL